MPRYVFRCTDGERVVTGSRSVELADRTAARIYALAIVRGIKRRTARYMPDWSKWVVEISDESAGPFARIPFALGHTSGARGDLAAP